MGVVLPGPGLYVVGSVLTVRAWCRIVSQKSVWVPPQGSVAGHLKTTRRASVTEVKGRYELRVTSMGWADVSPDPGRMMFFNEYDRSTGEMTRVYRELIDSGKDWTGVRVMVRVAAEVAAPGGYANLYAQRVFRYEDVERCCA